MIIFDANDIDYLINQFDVSSIRHEITNARTKLEAETNYLWQLYYQDYIAICQFAIHILQPTKVPIYSQSSHAPSISAEDIKTKHDITDYIGQFVHLRKSGNKFQGLCPFHSDKKHPSLFIYPNEQSYHCFGCQKHGDIITFVMEYNHVDFKEAINRLNA